MLLTYRVCAQDEGTPLGLLLRRQMAISDTLVRQTKRESRPILVDGKHRFTNQAVHAGERVFVDLPDYPPLCLNEGMRPNENLSILYQDAYLLCVWKPAGLQTHPSPSAPRRSDTLEARVISALGAPAHPVHRLDADTSGIVLFARFPYVQSVLQSQMQTGSFSKEYRAYVFGVPEALQGTIQSQILQTSPESYTRIISDNGRPAESRFRVLASFSKGDSTFSYLLLHPISGRTHQLRVHLTSIGHPILGDNRYATSASLRLSQELGISRQQLCCIRLAFIHPITHEPLVVSSREDLELSTSLSPSPPSDE